MIYQVYANKSNIGDLYSALGIRQLIGGEDFKNCYCDTPFLPATMETLGNAGPGDLIVIGGGGLVMDYFLPFWKAFGDIADRVPFVTWGIGCCDYKQEPTMPPAQVIERILAKSRLNIVRDELTWQFLGNLPLPEPVHCPAIHFVQTATATKKNLLQVVNYDLIGAYVYQQMGEVCRSYASGNNLNYKETNNRVSHKSEIDKIHQQYAKAGVIVSSALHGCIIGLAMGQKVIAVSGDRKIDAFMQLMGLEEWLLEPGEVGRLGELLAQVADQPAPVKQLDDTRKANEKIAAQVRSLLV